MVSEAEETTVQIFVAASFEVLGHQEVLVQPQTYLCGDGSEKRGEEREIVDVKKKEERKRKKKTRRTEEERETAFTLLALSSISKSTRPEGF